MIIEQCAICGREFECNLKDIAGGKTGEPVCPNIRCQNDQYRVTVVTVDA